MEIKNRQQTLVIAAIIVLGLFAGDKLVFDPLLKGWNARAKTIRGLRGQLSDAKALLQREQAIRSHWGQMQRNTLTNNVSVAEQQFFLAMERWQQDSRVTITGTTPQWKTDADDYTTYQCRLDASGTISTLSKFLYDIESEPMALKLESVELSVRDKEGQQLSLGLQVSGLVLNNQSR